MDRLAASKMAVVSVLRITIVIRVARIKGEKRAKRMATALLCKQQDASQPIPEAQKPIAQMKTSVLAIARSLVGQGSPPGNNAPNPVIPRGINSKRSAKMPSTVALARNTIPRLGGR